MKKKWTAKNNHYENIKKQLLLKSDFKFKVKKKSRDVRVGV
jgi:hypothetical protein